MICITYKYQVRFNKHIMQQLGLAETSFKNVLISQQQQLRTLSENVATGFIGKRNEADSKRFVSQSLIADLTYQIQVLESIKGSGAKLEDKNFSQISNYLTQYKQLREELIRNNTQVQKQIYQNAEQEEGYRQLKKMNLSSSKKGQQGLEYEQKNFGNEMSIIDSQDQGLSHESLKIESIEQGWDKTKRICKKKGKLYLLIGIQYLNLLGLVFGATYLLINLLGFQI